MVLADAEVVIEFIPAAVGDRQCPAVVAALHSAQVGHACGEGAGEVVAPEEGWLRERTCRRLAQLLGEPVDSRRQGPVDQFLDLVPPLVRIVAVDESDAVVWGRTQ